MSTIRGFDVRYRNRGSWYAYRRVKGKIVDEVPVAWDTDWIRGNPPGLIVWFQDQSETKRRLDTGASFVVAVAKKRTTNASSKDINRLFDVMPVEAIADPNRPAQGATGGVRCTILGECKHADELMLQKPGVESPAA